ncbi:MAG TPA: SIMPL domain-containing protein [Candidatus Krumholzibacterium sp.]|nr:SIMPL domain-containing protein [Candidatus Krumholzibacterium sp.]
MKTKMIMGVLSILLPLAVMANAGEISTSGSATVSLAPDNADIHIMIITQDAKPDIAAAENARVRDRVVAVMSKLGFGKDEIITADYRVDTEYEYDRTSGARKKTGYRAVHRIKLNTGDFSRIGVIIDRALEAGATEISGVNYFSSKMDEARREALTMAVREAYGDAEAIASTLGGSLGELVELSSGGTGRPVIPMKYAERSMAAQTEVVPDELSVTVTVTGRWVLSEKDE